MAAGGCDGALCGVVTLNVPLTVTRLVVSEPYWACTAVYVPALQMISPENAPEASLRTMAVRPAGVEVRVMSVLGWAVPETVILFSPGCTFVMEIGATLALTCN